MKNVDLRVIEDTIDPELKKEINISKIADYLRSLIREKQFIDGINVIKNPQDETRNVVQLEDSIGLNIQRVIAPVNISLDSKPLDPNAKNISKIERARRNIINDKTKIKSSKRGSKKK